ncbi:MAG TPA: AAA family ATPase [Jiangellaceae bacterium]
MTLLERDAQLASLAAAQRDAAAGKGSMVAVTGAAGIGKTALVQQFAGHAAGAALWGLCDDLVTPRPLGPFRDMFTDLSDKTDLSGFLEAALDQLARLPRPAVLVVEDAHWADEATLDALRFLGRRIRRTSAVLIVTYRDDEVPADHPLRLSLGAIPAADIRRIRLEPLSPEAVARLAGRPSAEVTELYALTGGNPLFVHEALAAPGAAVPPTIQDAVMARVGKLDGMAKASVELASVVPGRVERWLLDACEVSTGVDGAIRRGVLFADAETVAFTNELARRAVEDGLSPSRRRRLHLQVLDVLADGRAEPARLAHHALRAGDAKAVARFAPQAARRAASLESHRAAAEHFEQALAHTEHIAGDELAELLEEYALECRLLGRNTAAMDAVRRALELGAGRTERRGRLLTLLSEIYMLMERYGEAEDAAARAVSVLERLSPTAALAAAHAHRARLAMMSGQAHEAIEWGEHAHRLARRSGSTMVRSHAGVTVGSARWQLDPDESKFLVEALDAARSAGCAYPAARAYFNLADGNRQLMRYEQALGYIADGLAFCYDNDQLLDAGYLLACRALCYLDLGRWTQAEREAERSVDTVRIVNTERTVLWVKSIVRARRGDKAAGDLIDELGRLADDAGSREAALRAALARAEWLFLTGSADWPARWKDADRVREMVAEFPLPWSTKRADAALWLARAGLLDERPHWVVGPRALQIEGRWEEAADGWAALGRPYDQADALADAPEPGPLLAALEILDRLGATARASMVRAKLAAIGVRPVPRGPRRATQQSPAGLTPRQTEVLALLADDLTYREIADALHLSLKTVDHHVSAVRSKLAVSTRHDAVAAARRLGIVPPGTNGRSST